MTASLEAKNRTRAYMITGGFAGLMILLMFLIKWDLSVIEPIAQETGIDVEITLPPDPPEPPKSSNEESGGGGGNPVQAAGPAGVAAYTPPTTSKEVDEDEDKENPEVTTPKAVNVKAPKINETSVAKAEPKPVPVVVFPRTAFGTFGAGVSTIGLGSARSIKLAQCSG